METKITLPREKKRTPVKSHLQNIPLPLWERMVVEGKLSWGTVTPFINEAIREKLDRINKERRSA